VARLRRVRVAEVRQAECEPDELSSVREDDWGPAEYCDDCGAALDGHVPLAHLGKPQATA
jgi:hypothetical protein